MYHIVLYFRQFSPYKEIPISVGQLHRTTENILILQGLQVYSVRTLSKDGESNTFFFLNSKLYKLT